MNEENIGEAYNRLSGLLIDAKIPRADYEADQIILCALKTDGSPGSFSLEDNLTPTQQDRIRQIIDRRLAGEPLAYITGVKDFYGLDIIVNPNVLIPRPETGVLVEKAIVLAGNKEWVTIADIGTGSGVIAVTLALKLAQAKIYASDISPKALEVARLNSLKHGVADRVTLLLGDLLEPLPEKVDIIVANLPYVRKPHLDAYPVGYEPILALEGGADGLREIKRLCQQAPGKLQPGGSLLLEIGPAQKEIIIPLIERLNPLADIEVAYDFNGQDRMICIVFPPEYSGKGANLA